MIGIVQLSSCRNSFKHRVATGTARCRSTTKCRKPWPNQIDGGGGINGGIGGGGGGGKCDDANGSQGAETE
jgi:uncharacterized membrane protein